LSGAATARPIGPWTAVALVMGNMIGSGVFLLPASLAPYRGVSLAGWIVSAAGSILLAFVFARLARSHPISGGPYAYTRLAFGDLAGFVVAWGYWISTWCTNAALAVTLVGYLDPFIPSIVRHPPAAAALAVGLVWMLTVVNIAGIRGAGRVQIASTALKILPLLAIGVAGCLSFDASHFGASQAGTFGSGVMATATLTLWAFLGLECATIPAGSTADAIRTIPRATIVGTVLTAVIYILATVGVMSLLDPGPLAKSTAPFADAARNVFGDRAAEIVAIGAAISCFGALNGWVLIVGQIPLAVAMDGLFPRVFGRLSASGTPAVGMTISACLSTALVAMNYSRSLVDLFTFIILLATLSTLIPYTFCSLAAFVLRRHDAAMPWSTGALAAAGLAFVYAIFAIAGAGVEVVLWGLVLLACGIPVFFYQRRFAPG
jgi:APA family basic amino acid/polyamine antiporter